MTANKTEPGLVRPRVGPAGGAGVGSGPRKIGAIVRIGLLNTLRESSGGRPAIAPCKAQIMCFVSVLTISALQG